MWAPTQRISKRNSTGNASWGVGPNIEKLDSQFLQTMQVGGANTEADEKSAYNNVQVGGPNTEAGGKSAYNNVQVGWDNDKVILFL